MGGDFGGFAVSQNHNSHAAGSRGLCPIVLEEGFELILDGSAPQLMRPEPDQEGVAKGELFLEMAFGMNAREVIGLSQFLPRDTVAMQKLPLSLRNIVEDFCEIYSARCIHIRPADLPFKLN